MERIRLNPLGMEKSPAAGGMPKIAPMTHVASMVGGPLHNYLGHFAQPKFMMAGHNTNLTMGKREGLKSSQFAAPGEGKGKGGKGSGSYPIPDANHARLALSMVSKYGSSAKKAEVRAAVHRKYPGIK